jgi:hypothetical protein
MPVRISVLDASGETSVDLSDPDAPALARLGLTTGYGPLDGTNPFPPVFPGSANPLLPLVLEGDPFITPAQLAKLRAWELADANLRTAGIAGPDLLPTPDHDPTVQSDPTISEPFDHLSDFAAGVADSLSMGLTSWIRDKLEIDDVDYSSKSYIGGEVAEIVVETLVTIGSSSLRKRAAAYAGEGRNLLEKNARPLFRKLYEASGGIIHHWNPVRQGRFPLPYEWAARGFWNMVHVSVERHAAEHAWIRTLDKLDVIRTWTSPVRSAGNAIIQHGLRSNAGRAEIDYLPETSISLLPKVTVYACGADRPGKPLVTEPSESTELPATRP